MRHRVAVLLSVSILGLSGLLYETVPAASASPTLGTSTIRLWMLPPVDGLGNTACLTQSWHGTSDPRVDDNRSLDWRAGNAANTNCNPVEQETVRLRLLGASINETQDGTFWNAMYATIADLGDDPCRGGIDQLGKVKFWAYTLSGAKMRGFMFFAHSSLTPSQANIQVRRGPSRSSAYLNSWTMGTTTEDGPAPCWSGWHVHENNSEDATMYWGPWNTAHYNVNTSCHCFVTTNDDNWIRQMTTTVTLGE
jgi:hypothetical protein